MNSDITNRIQLLRQRETEVLKFLEIHIINDNDKMVLIHERTEIRVQGFLPPESLRYNLDLNSLLDYLMQVDPLEVAQEHKNEVDLMNESWGTAGGRPRLKVAATPVRLSYLPGGP